MTFSTKDIAIVILNWNGKKLLEQFLPSVLKFSDEATIYVADNASTDGSINHINKNFTKIKIIQNQVNGGYAKGYNDALASIDEPILCLMNSDIEVTQNWLPPIIEAYNTNKNTAIVQPKILDFKNKLFFEYAGAGGGFIDTFGYPFCRGRIFDSIEKDNGQYNDTTPIFWASGACFFIKNKVFKSLNGFDESYFAHMEEIDLCWRAFNQNYNTTYVGTSTVFHVGGATLKNTNPQKTYLNFRNSLFTLVKNTDKYVFRRVIIRMVLDGVAALKFLITLKPLHFISILRAHGSFYYNFFNLLKQRKQLNQLPNYATSHSIVWDYFIKRKKTFNCL